MIKTRVISSLLWDGSSLVKGRRFRDRRLVGSIMQAVRVSEIRGVDELVILDVSASAEGRGPDFEAVKRLTACCFMPVAMGGGVRSVEDVGALLKSGGDKAVIGSALFDPDLIGDAARRFGSQALTAAVDASEGRCFIRSGTEAVDLSATDAAIDAAARGAGEILLTSIDREGTGSGYDLDLIEGVAKAVSVPVVAAGGAGEPRHLLEALEAGAHAVAVGSMFLFQEHSPRSVRKWLKENGVNART